MIGALFEQLVARDHVEAVLLFARLPWPVRWIVGRVRTFLGRLRLRRAQRAWVRDIEEEERRDGP